MLVAGCLVRRLLGCLVSWLVWFGLSRSGLIGFGWARFAGWLAGAAAVVVPVAVGVGMTLLTFTLVLIIIVLDWSAIHVPHLLFSVLSQGPSYCDDRLLVQGLLEVVQPTQPPSVRVVNYKFVDSHTHTHTHTRIGPRIVVSSYGHLCRLCPWSSLCVCLYA